MSRLAILNETFKQYYKGKADVVQSMKPLKKMCTSPSVISKIFDMQVQPIILYGAEIWGVSNCEKIEKIHLYMLKSFLNVTYRTPNLMIYGDTGRFPMYIQATIRSVKYWLRLLKMENRRYPRKVYQMMLGSHNSTWAGEIRDILFDYDFHYVWADQSVQEEK